MIGSDSGESEWTITNKPDGLDGPEGFRSGEREKTKIGWLQTGSTAGQIGIGRAAA